MRWRCPLPLAHVGGLMVVLRAAAVGAAAVLGPVSLEDDLVSLVPAQLARLCDRAECTSAPGAGRRVQPRATVLLGGASAPQALLERARAAGLRVRPSYGLTQACSTVTVAEPGDVDTSGRAVASWHVAVDARGQIVLDGPPGRIATGDLGRLLDDGRLVVDGRADDLIVSGGENVMPAEVEAVLLEHPAVSDVAVFGRLDPEWGQAVVARVVPARGGAPDPAELREHCRGRLARFKVPKEVEVVARLPRTPSGKLRRAALR